MQGDNQEPVNTARKRPDLGPTFGQTLGNLRFVGMAYLIYGILTCLTIVGALVGVPMIISANRLLGSIKTLEEYRLTGQEDHLAAAFHEMGGAFGIMKILIFINLVISFLLALYLLGFGGLAFLAHLAGQ